MPSTEFYLGEGERSISVSFCPAEAVLIPLRGDYDSLVAQDGKESACNAGDPGSIPGLGKSPGEENGNPLQYSCLGNPMDGGTWQTTVHRVAKSQTRLSDFTFTIMIIRKVK